MRFPLLCLLVLVITGCDGSPPGPVPAPLKEPPAARLEALDSETPVARARRAIEQVEGGAGDWKLFSVGADSSVLYGRLVPAPGHAAPEYRLGHLASNGARLSLPDALVTDAIALPNGGVARISGGRLLIADRAVASDVLPGLALSPDGRWLAFASGPEPPELTTPYARRLKSREMWTFGSHETRSRRQPTEFGGVHEAAQTKRAQDALLLAGGVGQHIRHAAARRHLLRGESARLQ